LQSAKVKIVYYPYFIAVPLIIRYTSFDILNLEPVFKANGKKKVHLSIFYLDSLLSISKSIDNAY